MNKLKKKCYGIIFTTLAIITTIMVILANTVNAEQYNLVTTIDKGVTELITTGWVKAQYENFPRFRIRENGKNTNKVVDLPGFCMDESKGHAGNVSDGFIYTLSKCNYDTSITNQLKYIIGCYANTNSSLKWEWTPEQQLAIWEIISPYYLVQGQEKERKGKSTITAFTNKQTTLREEMSIQSSAITTLSTNTAVELKRLNDNWYNVKYGNKDGYIYKDDIKYNYERDKNDMIVEVIEYNKSHDYVELSNGNYKNARELEDAILNLLYDSTIYANLISNSTIVNPSLTGSNAKVEEYDNDKVKIGPFQLSGNTSIIDKLEVKIGESLMTLDSSPYLINNSATKNLPDAGQEFYIIVKNFNTNGASNATVTIHYNYNDYENIILHVARKINSTGVQPILIAEGTPEEETGSSEVTISIAKPTNYTISLNKKDKVFGKPVPNATFSVKSSDGTKKTIKTNGNGVATVTLTANSVGKDNITITETEVGEKWSLLSKPIKLKVTKNIENNKYVVTSMTNGTNLPANTTMSFDKNNATITINAEDPANITPGYYKIDLNKLDSQDANTSLEGATFNVKVNNITYNNMTVNEEKIIDITSEGTDIIEITETKAPNNYKKLNGTLKLKVTKKADETSWSYKVADVKITQKFTDENGKNIDAAVVSYNSNTHKIKLDIKNEREKIKLSGYVWEDISDGKETKIDGKKNNNDRFISGIQVTLHTSNEKNILYMNKPSLRTTTDKDGYYEFEVPKGYSYYIEFTYNGQNYQHTKYTPWTTTSNNNEKTSNATERKSTRDDLNEILEEIKPNMFVTANDSDKKTKIDNTINEKDATYIGSACYRISAYTGGFGNEKNIKYYSTTSDNINLGLTKRETVDLTIRKDVYKATLSINGYSQDYIYNKRNGLETDANGNSYWDINARQSDVYYGTNYERAVRSSDYNYNGENKLSAEVTYKVSIRNQSGLLNTKLTELVDYYDEDYTFKEAYIQKGNNKTTLIALEESKYTESGHQKVKIRGYQKMYFNMADTTIKPGEDLELYVVFTVKVDSSGKLIVDDGNGDVGKGNLVEIMGYKTYYGENAKSPNDGNSSTYQEYKSGDVAGRVDVDSNPGNATSIDEKTFEDDTDRAPYIKFTVTDNNPRTVKGVVWEDKRTVEGTEQGNAVVGDGIRQNGESLVESVIVELWNADTNNVAQVWNGTQWVDARTESNKDNGYSIANFIPGNYYVMFKYNDGQNYKSTTYNYEKVEEGFNIEHPDILGTYKETTDVNYSDARDLWGDKDTPGTREYVNNNNGLQETTESDKLTIVTQPENQYADIRESATFTIEATGGGNIKYQWYKKNENETTGILIKKATDREFTITIKGTNDFTYSYYCVVTNDKGESVTSNTVQVKKRTSIIESDKLSIITQPEDQYIKYGDKATFTIEATGGTNIKYQWHTIEGDVDKLIDGATEKTYTTESMSADQDFLAYFYCIVTNDKGESVKSNTVQVKKRTSTRTTDKLSILTNDEGDSIGNDLVQASMGEYEMHAVTGKIRVNFEANSKDTNPNSGRKYDLENIDFGLQERPKAQLTISKEITNAKVILANGSVLFDASGRATNVMWQDKKTHEYGYEGKLMTQPIVNRGSQQVLLTMDEELMHGANINITYKISVKNIGEVDYASKKFYYTGERLSNEPAITTTVCDIVDYAGASGSSDPKSVYNNLKFNANENLGWTLTTAAELKNDGLVQIKDSSGNDITSNIQKYNTILKYNFNKELKPDIESPEESAVATTLTLSQVITPDSNSDDQKYSNMVEILTFKNGVGRKMTYSIVGNQDPDGDIAEVDADLSQLTILPPFGQRYGYYILGIGISIIIIAGIIIIKKKVLNK